MYARERGILPGAKTSPFAERTVAQGAAMLVRVAIRILG